MESWKEPRQQPSNWFGKRDGKFILGLLLLPLLLAGCSLPGGRRIPQSPWMAKLERKVGLIAFIGADGNVYTMNQGGDNLTAITDDAHFSSEGDPTTRLYQALAWSPDSSHLAFVGVTGSAFSAEIDSASLYTLALDDQELDEVHTSDRFFPFYLYWSPDSQYVSFLSNRNLARGLLLQRVSADGGTVDLLDAGTPYFWNWSPNGQEMLIHAGSFGPAPTAKRLSVLALGEGTTQESLLDLSPASFQAPAWSSDGEHLLVAVEENGEQSLVVADVSGNLLTTLTTFEGNIAFSLSPDGEKVAMISGDNLDAGFLQGQLTVFSIDNPDEMYTSEEENVMAFFWAPDSQQIAYFPYQVLDVILVPEAGEEEEEPQTAPVNTVSLSVMEMKKGESHKVTDPFRPTDQFLGVLLLFTQYQHSATIWSPDSENLVLSALFEGGAPVIWVVRANGKMEPRYLINGVLAFWSWE